MKRAGRSRYLRASSARRWNGTLHRVRLVLNPVGCRGNTGRFAFVAVLGAMLASSSVANAKGSLTKGPWVQSVTSDSAVIRVEVDPPSPVSVELSGPTAGGSHSVVVSSEARSFHAISLKGLLPSKSYTYSVRGPRGTKSAAFVTAPPDEGDAPFRFLVYGDNRTDDAAHATLVRAMAAVSSDFLVHTGDFVEDGASSAQWETFFEIEAPLLGTRSIFSAVGNHELTDGAGIAYARFFGPTVPPPGAEPSPARSAGPTAKRPEHLRGSHRWGNTRFFFLNGMVSYQGTAERSWLEQELTKADTEAGLKWRVVVVHHGPWSSGPHGKNARLHDAGIIPLLGAHKVDLVLSGHDHIYERGFSDGLAYVVSGGGGAPVYKVKSVLPPAKKVESVHHFVEVKVNAVSMQLAAVRADGTTIERCALNKGFTGWDCDQPAGDLSAASSPSRASSPMAPSGARCGCDVVGGPATNHGAAVALATAAYLVRRRRASRRS